MKNPLSYVSTYFLNIIPSHYTHLTSHNNPYTLYPRIITTLIHFQKVN
jgi:hypothetical protein